MAGPVLKDTSFKVETPEGIEYTLYPAGLAVRVCAYGIDSLFQWIFLIIFTILYYVILKSMAGFWLIMLVRFALDWFYHVFWELFCAGQSPGKRFLGLKVVQNDGSPVNAGSSFIRNLLRFVDSFIGLYLIAFLSAAFSSGFRRPGDWAAGTLVIYTWQSQSLHRAGGMDWLSRFPPAAPGRALSFEEKQGILMFARRYPLLGPARADEIAAPLASSFRAPSAGDDGPAVDFTGPGASPSAYLLGIARTFAGSSETVQQQAAPVPPETAAIPGTAAAAPLAPAAPRETP